MGIGVCPVCGAAIPGDQKIVNHLSGGTVVCEKCAAKTRFLYPVQFDTEKRESSGAFVNGEYDTQSTHTYESRYMINPVESMTLEEFKQALEETDKKRAQEVAEYKEFKCALLVSNVERIISTYSDINLNEKYKKGIFYSLSGLVIYGELHRGDTLVVRRKEREETIRVPSLSNFPCGEIFYDTADAVYEGSVANMTVEQDLSFVYAGDILVVR